MQTNPHDKRNARIAYCFGGLALIAFWLIVGVNAWADIYQCQDSKGCIATINTDDGTQKKVIFQKGDVVCTSAGWVVSTDDGWVRLRSRRGDRIPQDVGLCGLAPQPGDCSPWYEEQPWPGSMCDHGCQSYDIGGGLDPETPQPTGEQCRVKTDAMWVRSQGLMCKLDNGEFSHEDGFGMLEIDVTLPCGSFNQVVDHCPKCGCILGRSDYGCTTE